MWLLGLVVGPIVGFGIGFGIAMLIFAFGDNEKFVAKILSVNAIDGQWVYLSAFVFSFLTYWVNMYPALLKKGMVLNGEGDKYRGVNQMIYKSQAPGSSESRILLVSEGPEGEYNRASRSLTHFTENSLQVLMPIVLLSYVFPIPIFVITVIFALARVLYAIGYAQDGGKRAPGFMTVMLINNILGGMCLLVGFFGMNKDLKPF
jgi:uncharacterized membrane protein YecN with MAPEG domain